MVYMRNDLVDWLANEIKTRRLSIRELARNAGISHTTIADVLSCQRAPTWEFCNAIARALNEPPEKLFRLAKLLPELPAPEDEPTLKELIELARHLTVDERQEILDFVLLKYRRRKRGQTSEVG